MLKWLKRDGDKHHRAESEDDTPFSFSLLLPGQKKLAGELADVNMSGAAISFPAAQCPDFATDERIRLSLMLLKSQKSLILDALVKGSKSSQDRILYQFTFIDTTHLFRDLDPALTSLFNRRGAFRVGPDPLTPIGVTLDCDGHSTKGSILDISLTGISLGVEKTVSRRFEYADQISMTFRLPGQKDVFRMVGRNVHLVSLQKGVRLGIEFDRKETENIRQQEQAISRYVMQRQLALLKRKADLPRGQ